MIDYDATVYEEEGKLVVWEGILVIAHTEAPDVTTLPLELPEFLLLEVALLPVVALDLVE